MTVAAGSRLGPYEVISPLGAGLVAMVVFVKAVDRVWRRERRPIVFDDRPRQATQRLDLFEGVAIYE